MEKLILVLGMHRSGTSALTGVLSLCGAEPGVNLLPAMEGVNSKGFWEHAEIVQIQEELLTALNSSWHDERLLPDEWWRLELVAPFRKRIFKVIQQDFGRSELALIKDPKTCRLLPMWTDVLRDVRCKPCSVLCIRDPREVAQSLEIRDGISKERSALLWLHHVLESELWSRGHERVLVAFDDLLDDWRSVVKRISSTCSLGLDIEKKIVQDRIDQFLEPALRHRYKDGNSFASVGALAEEVFRLMKDDLKLNRHAQEFDSARQQVAEMTEQVSPWSYEIQTLSKLKAVVSDKDAKITLLEEEIARVKHSLSWQVSSPLRAMQHLFRRSE